MSLRPTSRHPSKSIAQKNGLHEKRAIRCAIPNPKAPQPIWLAGSRAAGTIQTRRVWSDLDYFNVVIYTILY